jgi:hypothetical protein
MCGVMGDIGAEAVKVGVEAPGVDAGGAAAAVIEDEATPGERISDWSSERELPGGLTPVKVGASTKVGSIESRRL